MGSNVSTCGDVYSYGILLLEMFTGKRPTDEMFNDGLTLNNYVRTALLGRIEQITDPTMSLQELEGIDNNQTMLQDNNVLTASLNQAEQIVNPTISLQETEGTSNSNTIFQANQSLRIRECLFSIFSIGVECSAQVPSQRMNISDAVAQLRLTRGNFSSIFCRRT